MTVPKPLVEAAKEFLRVIVLAVIPLLIVQIEAGVVEPKAILLVAVIAGLRFIDKYMYELGKAEDRTSLAKGLTRF